MPTQINGLPAHVLLIHAVIVLLPIAALMLVASSLWPAARARLGVATPAVAFIALVLVPVTTNAGEWLQHHLGFSTAAIRKHVELGDQLLPWAIGVFLMAALGWFLARRYDMSWRPAATGGAPGRTPEAGRHEQGEAREPAGSGSVATATVRRPVATVRRILPVWATAAVAALSVAVSVGAMVQLYRIGDSGAQAVWRGVGSH